ALPAGFDLVILKALDPDPGKRYGSAAELRAQWQRVRTGLDPTDPRPGLLPHLARVVRRHPWVVATAALAVLLLGTLGAILFPRPGPDDPRLVSLPTEPPCERFVFVRLDDVTGEPIADRTYPGRSEPIRLPPGDYFVEVGWADGPFHQV